MNVTFLCSAVMAEGIICMTYNLVIFFNTQLPEVPQLQYLSASVSAIIHDMTQSICWMTVIQGGFEMSRVIWFILIDFLKTFYYDEVC